MSETVNFNIGGDVVSVLIEGGALAPGMSIANEALNAAVSEAQQAAEDATVNGAIAGAAAGTTAGATAGAAAGTAAGTNAANAVVGGKANAALDNVDPATGRTALSVPSKADVPMTKANQAAIPGSQIGITYRITDGGPSGDFIGGIWGPANYATYFYNTTFTTANTTAGESPASGIFSLVQNDGTDKDVVGVMAVAWGKTVGGALFGANIIAASNLLVAQKYVGLEVDVAPPSGGIAAPGTGGVYINAFNYDGCGPAIQFGGVGGGKFNNGLIIGGITSSGAGIAPGGGETMGSLINTGAATYTQDAIIVSNGQKIRFAGTGSVHGSIWNDSSNNLRIVAGATETAIIRDSTDSQSLVSMSPSGVNIEVVGGTYKVAGTQVVGLRGSAVANGVNAAAAPTQAEFNALVTQFNLLLARVRAHGLIAP